jgi:hypothetical protein
MLSSRGGKIEIAEQRTYSGNWQNKKLNWRRFEGALAPSSVASLGGSVAAEGKITLSVLKGYLACPYLAHLLLAGQRGVKSDYEIVLDELEETVRLKVTDGLRKQHSDRSLATGVSLDRPTLSKSHAFILDTEPRSDSLPIRIDGLKRVKGQSQFGDFYYVPMIFCGTSHIHKSQRLLLEVMGLFLSHIQGIAPSTGIIYYGFHAAATTVRFTSGLRAAEELVEKVMRLQQGDAVPKLLLKLLTGFASAR